jgi:dnd system-associated protein 4
MSLTPEIAKKSVKRNNKYNDVINLLWLQGSEGRREDKIFNNIKDIIIFAAMVGKKYEKRESLESDNTPITIDTFSGVGSLKDSRVDQHNLIFMFSLLIKKDMNYMRDEKIDEVIEEFEEYSNGGLSLIQSWLAESASDPLCILEKMISVYKSEESGGITLDANPFQ